MATAELVEDEVVEEQPDGMEELKSKYDRLAREKDEIAELERECADAELRLRSAQEHAKECKKEFEEAVAILRSRIRRAVSGQNELPFKEEGEAPRDHAGEAGLDALGLTEKEVEKLNEADLATVAELEKFIREDEWWHQKIKGFGDAKVTKVLDALTDYRMKNPVPTAEEVSEPESTEASANGESNGGD